MTRTGAHESRSAVAIMEEAVHVLKKDPFRLVPYYIGALPFILGLIYFWTEMSAGAGAWRHSSQTAWALSLLFVWMKVWQSVYARGLLSGVRGAAPVSWGAGRILRTLAIQTAVQPWAFIAVPAALVALVPFPRVLAFFQNVTLYGGGDDRELGVVLRRSWRQAGLWPMENTVLIWLGSPLLVVLAAFLLFAVIPSIAPVLSESHLVLLLLGGFALIVLSPLAMVVALNIGVSMFLAPRLFHTLFGIETALSRSNDWAANDMFMVVLCGLVYLCLDPLLKACYCLRCFYGESLRTGEDLKTELRGLKRLGPVAVVVFALLFGIGSWDRLRAEAAPVPLRTPISPTELDSALDRTIRLPRYEWRMPRETPPPSHGGNPALRAFLAPIVKGLHAVWKFCSNAVSKLFTFLEDILFRVVPDPQKEKVPAWTLLSRALIVVPILCLVAAFAFFGWRMWKKRKPLVQAEATGAKPIPDITRDGVDASALPEDGWMEMARGFSEDGELRYAVRALYLATLAFLGRRRFVTLERHKSDREYEREIVRRTHADPRPARLFSENRGLFERTWYGLHEATPGLVEQVRLNYERIKEHDQS